MVVSTREGNERPRDRRPGDGAARGCPAKTDWTAAECASGDARLLHLFFSDVPEEIDEAKQVCGGCTLRVDCLRGAMERREPWGVWGGHLFERGEVIAVKRSRGRPRLSDLERQRELQATLELELGVA